MVQIIKRPKYEIVEVGPPFHECKRIATCDTLKEVEDFFATYKRPPKHFAMTNDVEAMEKLGEQTRKAIAEIHKEKLCPGSLAQKNESQKIRLI